MARQVFWIFLLVFFAGQTIASDQSPATIWLNQAQADLPSLTVWLHAEDEQAHILKGLQTEQFAVTVGEWSAVPQSIKSFADTGEGVAYVFLIDVSKSLSSHAFKQVQTGLNAWIDQISDKDKVSLIRFGEGVDILQDFSSDKKVLKQRIASLALKDQKTFLYQALLKALELTRREDVGLPKRRALVMLSDGLDDSVAGVTLNEVLHAIQEQRIPLYAIGFSDPAFEFHKDQGLQTLGVLAHASGGLLLQPSNDGLLADAYAKQHKSIQDSLELTLSCPDCKADGRVYPLTVHLQVGERRLHETFDLRLLPKANNSANSDQSKPTPNLKSPELGLTLSYWEYLKREFSSITNSEPKWKYLIGIMVVLFLVGISLFVFRRFTVMTAKTGRFRSDDMPVSIDEEIIDTNSRDNKIARPSSPGQGIKISFYIVGGKENGHCAQAVLSEPLVLGRDKISPIKLMDDERISARHAEIFRDEYGSIFLKDLGSTNGTLLNGIPIASPHKLQDDDLIRLGRTEFRVTFQKPILGNAG